MLILLERIVERFNLLTVVFIGKQKLTTVGECGWCRVSGCGFTFEIDTVSTTAHTQPIYSILHHIWQ
jgi:hypothetical protein